MKADVKSTALVAKQFSREEIDLIKSQIAKGASDTELKYFLELCKQTGLNPFLRHIYLIERQVWNKNTQRWDTIRVPQVSIDGFRATAEDSDKYAGQVGPHWCGPDGEWHDVWVKDEPPVAARVGVLRHGFTEPLFSVAKYKEYCPLKDGKPVAMWAKMPDLMIAKCSEALALRKAFPHKLGGFYAPEEMEQADTSPAAVNEGTGVQHITVNAGGGTITVDQPKQHAPEPEYTKASQIADEIAVAEGAPKGEMSGQAWRRFGEQMVAQYRKGAEFTPEQQAKIELMQRERPAMHKKLIEAMAGITGTGAQTKEPEAPPQPNPGDDPDAYLVWLIDQTSKYDKKKDLTDFFDIQRPLWKNEKCFPPDIDEWEELFRKREKELT